jgi:hypothetical protein
MRCITELRLARSESYTAPMHRLEDEIAQNEPKSASVIRLISPRFTPMRPFRTVEGTTKLPHLADATLGPLQHPGAGFCDPNSLDNAVVW